MDDDEMYVMDAGEIELDRRFDAFARTPAQPGSGSEGADPCAGDARGASPPRRGPGSRCT
jgi:hypothetical protein